MPIFLELIDHSKETEVEFKTMNDSERLEARGYKSKSAYLLSNMLVARENIFQECGLKEGVIKKLETPSEKMKKELAFIAAVCEEVLKDD